MFWEIQQRIIKLAVKVLTCDERAMKTRVHASEDVIHFWPFLEWYVTWWGSNRPHLRSSCFWFVLESLCIVVGFEPSTPRFILLLTRSVLEPLRFVVKFEPSTPRFILLLTCSWTIMFRGGVRTVHTQPPPDTSSNHHVSWWGSNHPHQS